MSLTCPTQGEITRISDAEKAYKPSFLTVKLEYDTFKTLKKETFLALLEKAKAEKRYLEQNAFSFRQLVDSVHREFCFVNSQYLYLLREYVKKPEESLKKKVQEKNQTLQDLLSCLHFLSEMTDAGKDSTMVKPSESRKPFSYWLLASVEKFQNIGNKYMEHTVELREQMKNLDDKDLVALRKDMVEYSKEKNKSATNLLGVYAFLNLTAIGLLIYIFRSK